MLKCKKWSFEIIKDFLYKLINSFPTFTANLYVNALTLTGCFTQIDIYFLIVRFIPHDINWTHPSIILDLSKPIVYPICGLLRRQIHK